ncbi:biopolymer transporter ExbD [Polyangium jinanense]|uniref:Energy transducer TonB n=1 Tax=Polyangium jinanense TaxID=2829994 RepID=A0A9X4ATK2_9BACT|nr:biopolymer transporter ExbD [Polyangium jinanense]MDC3955655.1 energy transducer TonB [Polyangium jinanense]MDC3982297.1 energy transducer TonB [Polyangium jinanense]
MRQPVPFRRALLGLLPLLAACQATAPPPAASSPSTTPPAVPAIPVDLPQAAEWSNVVTVFVVVVNANGATMIDGNVVHSDEEIRAAAARAHEKAPDVRAVIQADSAAPWKDVVHTMDLLRQGGIAKIAFGVAPQRPAPSDAAPPPGGVNTWDCQFPKAADAAEIDDATVMLRVWVTTNGSPEWVQILNDPGHGFGMVAAQCAMVRKYSPALDKDGRPMAAKTPPIRVRFIR